MLVDPRLAIVERLSGAEQPLVEYLAEGAPHLFGIERPKFRDADFPEQLVFVVRKPVECPFWWTPQELRARTDVPVDWVAGRHSLAQSRYAACG